jgi:hypothetical protein
MKVFCNRFLTKPCGKSLPYPWHRPNRTDPSIYFAHVSKHNGLWTEGFPNKTGASLSSWLVLEFQVLLPVCGTPHPTIVYHDLQIGIVPILSLDSLYNLIDSIFLTFSSPTYPPPNDHAHRTSPIVKQKSPCCPWNQQWRIVTVRVLDDGRCGCLLQVRASWARCGLGCCLPQPHGHRCDASADSAAASYGLECRARARRGSWRVGSSGARMCWQTATHAPIDKMPFSELVEFATKWTTTGLQATVFQNDRGKDFFPDFRC